MSDLRNLYPCGRIARRRFLFQSAAGFMGSALSSLWAQEGKLMQDARLPGTPKAKSVIFLFMCGGVSHIDTFDPKDNKHAGKIMDAIGFGDNNAPMGAPSFRFSGPTSSTANRASRSRTGFRTSAKASTTSPWCALCIATKRTIFRPSWRALPASPCDSLSILVWEVGCRTRWERRTRICRRL